MPLTGPYARSRIATLGLALVFVFSAVGLAAEPIANGIRLPFGFFLDPHISLGHIGIAISVCVQIGRWGRKAMLYLKGIAEHAEAVPGIIERLDRVEDRLGLPPIWKGQI